MNWIGPALVSEGPTDDRFFSGVIRRTIEDLAAREFIDPVEVADVFAVRSRSGPASVADSIVELKKNSGSYNIVIYHHDIGSNREKALNEWVRPMREAWASTDIGDPLVFLLPARETEAWTLVDGEAIRCVFGVNWSDAYLEIPERPSQVHQIRDPKRVIKDIADKASGRPVDYLTRLGELVDLTKLAQVEAYREWLDELTHSCEVGLSLRRTVQKGRSRI